jgi:hypothetical protein
VDAAGSVKARDLKLRTCEQLHRYEFAAQICADLRVLDLCCENGYGSEILARSARSVLGVDADNDALVEAYAVKPENVSYEYGGPLEFLTTRSLVADFDVIVCFSVERLGDWRAGLSALAEASARGLGVITSLTNGKALRGISEFEVPAFGWDDLPEVENLFPSVMVMRQFVAEGSLIASDEIGFVEVDVQRAEQAEPEFANSFLFLAEVPVEDRSEVGNGTAQLTLAPTYNRLVKNLEDANQQLRRRNVQLGREHLGRTNSGAASHVNRVLAAADQRIAELQAEIGQLQAKMQAETEELQAEVEERQAELEERDVELERMRARVHEIRLALAQLPPSLRNQIGSLDI